MYSQKVCILVRCNVFMSAPVIIITYWGWDMCSLVEMYECLRGASGTAPDYTVICSR